MVMAFSCGEGGGGDVAVGRIPRLMASDRRPAVASALASLLLAARLTCSPSRPAPAPKSSTPPATTCSGTRRPASESRPQRCARANRCAPPGGTATAYADGGTVPADPDGWMWDLTVPGNNDHDFYVAVSGGLTTCAVGPMVAVLVHNCPMARSNSVLKTLKLPRALTISILIIFRTIISLAVMASLPIRIFGLRARLTKKLKV